MSPQEFIAKQKTPKALISAARLRPFMTVAAMAKAWGVAPSTLTRYLNGQRPPSYSIMMRFHVASGGKVGLADWLKIYPDWKAAEASRTQPKSSRKGARSV